MGEQKNLFAVDDPGNYRKLLEPVPQAEMEKRCQAFMEELYQLRNKHGIQDVHCIVCATVLGESDGLEGTVMLNCHFGDTMFAESMTAWALGQEQAKRQEAIAALLTRGGGISKGKRAK